MCVRPRPRPSASGVPASASLGVSRVCGPALARDADGDGRAATGGMGVGAWERRRVGVQKKHKKAQNKKLKNSPGGTRHK